MFKKLFFLLILFLTVYVQADENKLYFVEENNKLVYETGKDSNIFMQHLDMIPGSTYTDEMKIQNGTKKDYTLYLKVEEQEQSVVANELLDNINMVVYLNENVVYDGKIKGIDYRNVGVNLQDAVLLKKMVSNEEVLLKVDLKLDEKYDNKNGNDFSKINWLFYAQYEDNNPVIIENVPRTSSNSNMVVIGLITIIISLIFIFYGILAKKKQ